MSKIRDSEMNSNDIISVFRIVTQPVKYGKPFCLQTYKPCRPFDKRWYHAGPVILL